MPAHGSLCVTNAHIGDFHGNRLGLCGSYRSTAASGMRLVCNGSVRVYNSGLNITFL